jgi:hypothetical protein
MRVFYGIVCCLLSVPFVASGSNDSDAPPAPQLASEAITGAPLSASAHPPSAPPQQRPSDWPLGEACQKSTDEQGSRAEMLCGREQQICGVRSSVQAFRRAPVAEGRVLYGSVRIPLVGNRSTVVRVVLWAHDTLWVRAVVCPKCQAYRGSTFYGRPACMTVTQLTRLQEELGIEGESPLRTEAAWAEALSKLPPQPAPAERD